MQPSQPDHSKEDYGLPWSSQEWKSEVTAHDRLGKPDKTSWNEVQQVRPHHGDTLLDGGAQQGTEGGFMMDQGNLIVLIPKKWQIPNFSSWVNDAAEFVNKVKDKVRKRQKRMSNVADSGEEHSIIWGMFMAATMNAATFM